MGQRLVLLTKAHIRVNRTCETGFHQAVDHYLEVCEKIGQALQKSYSGKLTLRIPPETHLAVANAAEINKKNINQWVADVLHQAALLEQ